MGSRVFELPRYLCLGSRSIFAPGGRPVWGDNLHQAHLNLSHMAVACELCHIRTDIWDDPIGYNCYTNNCDGLPGSPSYSCAGCHGRDHGSGWPTAPGLRVHHENGAAPAGSGTCQTAACHLTDPTPLPEDVAPPYYGGPNHLVDSSCNDDAGTSEDWLGTTDGLDNDGDHDYDMADSDCAGNCGNGSLDGGETCDPPSSCPTASDCIDGDPCTQDILNGSPATCDSVCSNPAVTSCSNGDGCCPGSCHANNDNDCSPVCGNDVVESGETCDPPGNCPATCNDGNVCTDDSMNGSAGNCDVACVNDPITSCSNGDGCCPGSCNTTNDNDCSVTCDNGVIENGETCDPQSTCPTSCDDGNSCTVDSLTGSAGNCNAACSASPIVSCDDYDGCCPTGCDSTNDNDCSVTCGNDVVEAGETCDPQSTCPTSCDDGNSCTVDSMTGSSGNCNAACTTTSIVSCDDDDGCCPSGCDSTNDNDCSITCGNDVIEAGETCDPQSTCPSSCDDGNSCTVDVMTGSSANCNAACSATPIVSCADDDGCCPPGCDSTTDNDCSITCGNDVIESGETCDPQSMCPTSCDDENTCTVDVMTGSAANCNAACSSTAIVSCADDDGCCPPGCDFSTDNDCSESCGDSVVDELETCDPPESCPTDCDDGDPCTRDVMTGSASNCNVECTTSPATCLGGDGCCPDGCETTNDFDCGALEEREVFSRYLSGGCSCRAAPRPTARLGAVVLLALLGLFVARRRA